MTKPTEVRYDYLAVDTQLCAICVTVFLMDADVLDALLSVFEVFELATLLSV